jgi:hypothetical protein
MEAKFSSDTSVDFERITRLYISGNRTLYKHRCENLTSYSCFLIENSDVQWWQCSKDCGKRVLHYADCSDLFLKPPFTMSSQISVQLKCVRHFQPQLFNASLRYLVVLCKQATGQRIPEARGTNRLYRT